MKRYYTNVAALVWELAKGPEILDKDIVITNEGRICSR